MQLEEYEILVTIDDESTHIDNLMTLHYFECDGVWYLRQYRYVRPIFRLFYEVAGFIKCNDGLVKYHFSNDYKYLENWTNLNTLSKDSIPEMELKFLKQLSCN